MPKDFSAKPPTTSARNGATRNSIKKMMYAEVLNEKNKKDMREVQEALRGADANKLLFRKP